MEIGWIMGGFFVFMTIAYFAVAFFFPEIVGIQGKTAKKIEDTHKENTTEQDPDN